MSLFAVPMPNSKVFENPIDGTAVPLPHHVEDEARLVASPSKKRPADTLDSLTPRQKKARTDATEREQKRYQKFKDDPLCHVSPTDGKAVQCDRCGSHIKLSDKNNYDPQHWTKHRKLCVRRPDDVVAAMRADSSLGRRKTSCTPELTADSASERTGTSVSVKSEPPETRPSSPAPAPWLRARRGYEANYLSHQSQCRDYMALAHPDVVPYAPAYANYQEVVDDMRAWTPSRVRNPAWLANPEEGRAKLILRSAHWPSEPSEDESEDEDEEQGLLAAPPSS
ncbi:hypothetical protein BC628DRAFT_819975 [Trametes gibbosa]|nr:hypothetical protein BC628DRAFT_819975 [Trametes gibbosa]